MKYFGTRVLLKKQIQKMLVMTKYHTLTQQKTPSSGHRTLGVTKCYIHYYVCNKKPTEVNIFGSLSDKRLMHAGLIAFFHGAHMRDEF